MQIIHLIKCDFLKRYEFAYQQNAKADSSKTEGLDTFPRIYGLDS